jgi:hypothetical protein
MSRRAWLVVVWVYVAAGFVDASARVIEQKHQSDTGIGPANFAVAFAAGLFWPLDLVARFLLAAR